MFTHVIPPFIWHRMLSKPFMHLLRYFTKNLPKSIPSVLSCQHPIPPISGTYSPTLSSPPLPLPLPFPLSLRSASFYYLPSSSTTIPQLALSPLTYLPHQVSTVTQCSKLQDPAPSPSPSPSPSSATLDSRNPMLTNSFRSKLQDPAPSPSHSPSSATVEGRSPMLTKHPIESFADCELFHRPSSLTLSLSLPLLSHPQHPVRLCLHLLVQRLASSQLLIWRPTSNALSPSLPPALSPLHLAVHFYQTPSKILVKTPQPKTYLISLAPTVSNCENHRDPTRNV